ncbi:MAG TPA: VOC family protein [Bdellovibrionota bacterium]|jgi:catechol 2,3-dioxygenase-like lactoylglutathione lyase family enzyme|nr:VOC family protein [Bdellovibrionota bacterium]
MKSANKLVKAMGHAALFVEDIPRASKFYKDVLDLNPVWEGDQDWSNFELGGDDLSLVKKKGAVHPPHLGFYVASLGDLHTMHARVKATGVKTESIDLHRDGTSSFYFRDLDNNLLEMIFDPRKDNT